MKLRLWRRTDRVAVWLVAASLCFLPGDAPVQGSGAADRETLAALSNPLATASSSDTGTPSDLFVPVILTASGLNNSYYTSELTLTNRGSQTANLRYTYRAAAGGGNGTASETLAPGRQKILPNAIDYLQSLGVPLPSSGTRIGTLRVGVSGSSEVSVTVRTTTWVADGRAGLAYPGVAVADGFTEAVYLCGLRQNRQDRSNVAFQNMGASGNITVRATVFSRDPGDSRVLPDVVLVPGGFRQLNGILATAGYTQGYVRVERVSGTAPFYAYGVINDQANSDGSFVFPVTESSLAGVGGQTLPVIIEHPNFSSELIVTNFSGEAKAVDFGFVADGIATEDHTARFSLTLAAEEQRILPEIVEEMRRQGVAGLGRAGGTLAGAVFATGRRGDLSGVVIGARTGSRGGGGQYSVFYNAVPYGAGFDQEAWIDALQQNEENRSNLALVNTGEVDDGDSVFQLDLYDGWNGMLANTVTGIRIPARGWRQIDGILDKYAPGATQGYVRIQKISGNNPFLAYGVINDGGAPGQRSGDGAYLAAREGIIDPGTEEVTDREALAALYEATDGPNWINNENWLSDAPLGEWYGVETDGTGRVVRIRISYNLLAGAIPSEISTLTELQHLGLDNNGITGPLPAGLAKLRNLQVLNLHANFLQGPIPQELGNMSALSWLDLNGNSLTGSIPRELGKLSNLEGLDLTRNRLTGGIPAGLGGLGNLRVLRLDRNTLSGPVPSELGNLSALTWLSLRDNQLRGALPQSLLDLASLERLTVDRNPDLCTPGTSAFQTWLQGIEKDGAPFCSESDQAMLAMLYEDAGGSGWTNAEGWLGGPVLADWHGVQTDSLGRVVSLDLARNALGGRLPARLGELAHMTELRVEGNSGLAGRLPVTLSRLTLNALHYGGTGLCVPAGAPFRLWLASVPSHEGTGAECVPLSDREILSTLYESTDGANWRNKENWLKDAPLGDWQGVDVDDEGRVVRLELPFAGLSGPIPSELGELASLRSLDLANNGLSGSIPPELGKLARLAHLDIRFNNLSGSIPSELGGLVSLERMELRHNHLSGSISPELGKLSRLEVLFLENNSLTGPIPPELGRLESLRVVSLGANGLSGLIPKTLANLAKLTHLNLVRNRLTGRIPREFGSLPRLTGLFLGENDLTGAIPPELGNLAELTLLDVRDNRLAGPIPRELGRLSRLTGLHLAYNGLTGSLPPELGNLSALASLLLGHNRLGGSVPPELGRLTSLRELSLFGNAGLSGALPADLTALGRLEALMAGGTGLCAPSDAAFTAWLEGVEQHRVARCADEPTMAYLTQAVQSRQFPVPLIAGRDALLRVFVTAVRPTGAGIPPVRARFYRDGAETYAVDIPAKSTPIPTAVDEGDLEASANAEIPGEVVQPGLEMVIDVDPETTLDPSHGVIRRIPATGRIALDVRAMPTFRLTVVPLLWRESPDSAVLARTRGLNADDELFRLTRTILPVGDFEMAVHEPVVVTVNRGDAVIRQIELIWTLEGRRGHYLGLMSGNSRITGAGGTTRISALDLRNGDPSINGVTQAHEFGHNMSLMHTVRSQNAPDPSYPHAAGSIGAYGYDFRSAGSLVPPSALDVMGFANLSSWISDYHFTKALRFRLRDEGGAAANATAVRSLILWGGTDSDGAPLLEPAFVADAPPALPDSAGEYLLTGATANGAALFSLSFAMPETAHGDGGSSFAFVLPVRPGWEGSLASITLSGPAGSVTLDRDTHRPLAILRNPGNGQIRGILRDLPAMALSNGDAASAMALTSADAAVALSLEPGLEVVFSRGIPRAGEWWR